MGGGLVSALLCFAGDFGLLSWVGEWQYAPDVTEVNLDTPPASLSPRKYVVHADRAVCLKPDPSLKSQFNGQPIVGTLGITTIICSANPAPVLIVSQEDISKSLIFFTGDYQELAIPIVAR